MTPVFYPPPTIAPQTNQADKIRYGNLRQQREKPRAFSPVPPPAAEQTGNRRASPRPTRQSNPAAEPDCALPCERRRGWDPRRDTAAGLANDGDASPESATDGELIGARLSEARTEWEDWGVSAGDWRDAWRWMPYPPPHDP